MRGCLLSSSNLPAAPGSASHTSYTPGILGFRSFSAKKPSNIQFAIHDAADIEHLLFERNLHDKSKNNPREGRKKVAKANELSK